MAPKRWKGRIGRRVVAAAGVISVIAVAAPVGAASADTPNLAGLPALPALPAFSGLPAFTPVPLSFVGPSIGILGVAIGPTVIGSVFNGGTTVVVGVGPGIGGSTNASP
jgi:hypothetical protein